MMRCRKCDKEIQDREHRKVAEWVFCPDCFEELLLKPSEKETAGKEDTAKIPEFEAGTVCQVCKKEIADDALRKLGIWEVCHACFGILVSRPKQTAVEDEKNDTDAEDDENKGNDIQVDLTQSAECGGCGRTIPLGGGKETNGKILCPECHVNFTIRRTPNDSEEPDSREKDSMAIRTEIGNPDMCDCCGRKPRTAEALAEIEGFLICRACLSADSETALGIAREKHRRRLLRINDEIAR